MKALTTVIMVIVVLISITSVTRANDLYNTKVLFNGSKQINDSSSVSLVGTAVFPNIGHGPVFMMGGIGYSCQNKWRVKVMIGTFSKEQTGQMVFDIRGSFDALDPINTWADIEFYPKTGDWYTYMNVNYRIGNHGFVGVETENMHFANAKDNLGVGPQLVLPLSQGRIVLIGAYQFHNNGNQNQMWSRVALNF